MCFITKASKRGGNKQPSNWITNLGLRHKETWVGWLTNFSLGIGKKMVEGVGQQCGCQ